MELDPVAGPEPLFATRPAAGRELARHLDHLRGAVVLGLPRGGVVTAEAVARRLGCDLDVIVAREVTAPGRPDQAVGAVTADGSVYLDADLVTAFGVFEADLDIAPRRQAAAEREARLRGAHEPVSLEGRTVIVVDDGLGAPAGMGAALRSVRARRAARVIAAAPVGSTAACDTLRHEADDVVCPYQLGAYGTSALHYMRFDPVSEDDVRRRLAAHAAIVAGSAAS